MTIIYILFWLALVVIFSMIFIRGYEIKKEKTIISRKFRYFADKFLKEAWFSTGKKFHKISRLFGKEISQLPHRIKIFCGRLWGRIRNTVDNYFGHFSHHPNNHQKGAVSLYWKSVSDSKNKTKEIHQE